MFNGQVLDHKTLGPVVVVMRHDGFAGVVTLEDFRSKPWRDISKAQGGGIDAEIHDVKPETLRSRPSASLTLDEFIATHRTRGWKPKPLPKPRRLPKLSPAKFAELAARNGLKVHSWG